MFLITSMLVIPTYANPQNAVLPRAIHLLFAQSIQYQIPPILRHSAAPVLFPYPNILSSLQNFDYQHSCKVYIR